jgi:hypothetical protein
MSYSCRALLPPIVMLLRFEIPSGTNVRNFWRAFTNVQEEFNGLIFSL